MITFPTAPLKYPFLCYFIHKCSIDAYICFTPQLESCCIWAEICSKTGTTRIWHGPQQANFLHCQTQDSAGYTDCCHRQKSMLTYWLNSIHAPGTQGKSEYSLKFTSDTALFSWDHQMQYSFIQASYIHPHTSFCLFVFHSVDSSLTHSDM